MSTDLLGTTAFGVVIGWVAYRTMRRTATNGLADIATVLGAVGGGAVTALFPAGSAAFNAYGIGLAIGFFFYLATSMVLAWTTGHLDAVNEWLGTQPAQAPPAGLERPDNQMPPLP